MILAIDTATEFAGLALYNEDSVWAEEVWNAKRNHTVELAPRLHRMLTKAALPPQKLAGIAVSIGPGSYTGVRIGTAIAKGLALPHNIPVVSILTLDITAYPHQHQTIPVAAVARAGRKRILVGIYQWAGHIWGQTEATQLLTVAEFAAQLRQKTFIAGEINAREAAYIEKTSKGKALMAAPIHRIRRPGVLAELGVQKLVASGPEPLSALKPIYLSIIN